MKHAPLFHCCLFTAIYDLSSKVEFSCQYKVQNLEYTPLSLDYWWSIAYYFTVCSLQQYMTWVPRWSLAVSIKYSTWSIHHSHWITDEACSIISLFVLQQYLTWVPRWSLAVSIKYRTWSIHPLTGLLMKHAVLFHCLFFTAIYDLSSKVEFSCQYKVQNLEYTPLSLDYWWNMLYYFTVFLQQFMTWVPRWSLVVSIRYRTWSIHPSHWITGKILVFYLIRPDLKFHLFPLTRPTLKKSPHSKNFISIFSQEFFFLLSLQT